jgi:hypothetical protein
VPQILRPEIGAYLLKPSEVILMRMGDDDEIERSNLRAKILERSRPALHGIAIHKHVDPIGKLNQHHVPLAHREEGKDRDHIVLHWPPTEFPLGQRRVVQH